jgi:flagellar hook-associated protein 2
LLAFTSATPNPAPPAMSESAAAQDASFTVNGIAISSATNTVTDAIQGVTLTLKSEATTATTLTVARDTATIDKAAAKFVESYNALATQMKSLTAFGTDTKKAGGLAGDGTARQMLDQLRSIFTTPASGGTLGYLSEIGITTQAGGTLKFDSSKLKTALSNDFSDVVNLFSGATGFATRMDNWATSVTQTGGLISARTQNLNSSIDRYNEQIDRLELQMTELKKRYTTTYSNLNMMLSRMNDTSSYLTSQFG